MDNKKDLEKKQTLSDKEVHDSLLRLEQTIKITPPPISELEHLVETVQTKQRKKLYRELLLFWGIAIFVVTIVLWSYANYFLITVIGQFTIIAGLAGYFFFILKKAFMMRKDYQNE